MPRVNHVLKARKAIPSHDIKVGDSYYWWAFRFGGKAKNENDKVSDGGPLTHESKQNTNPPFAAPLVRPLV